MKPAPKGPKSFSHFETFDECRLEYYFRYVDKKPIGKTDPLRFGSAFHDFRFRYYSHCRDTDVDSDWEIVPKIAKQTFHDHGLGIGRWQEFLDLATLFAEIRSYNNKMGVEVKFGVDRDEKWSDFATTNGFRGILDGLEIDGDVGTVTDTKTSRNMSLPFTQPEIYAAFLSLRYPEVKEWRLVFDFIRFRKIAETRVLTAQLEEVRSHVWAKVKAIEKETKWEASPGEHCLTCPFFGICDYKMQGITKPETTKDVESMMLDFFQHQAAAKQIKRILKQWVNEYGAVKGKSAKADFYSKKSKSADVRALHDFLKGIKMDPVDFMTFPAEGLKKLMNDHQISDDIANFITIEDKPTFDIKKNKKGDDDEDE